MWSRRMCSSSRVVSSGSTCRTTSYRIMVEVLACEDNHIRSGYRGVCICLERCGEGIEGNMKKTSIPAVAEVLGGAILPLSQAGDDYDSLLDLIGDARVVLLGEASHGTHEFYRERARITRRLIQEKDFAAVAVEADWPDAYRVNRWVRCVGEDPSALAALGDFQRFPRWMWRNTEVLAFIEWLRRYNEGAAPDRRAGFYGLDLYSLFSSIEAVIGFLERVDPEAARRARYRYCCFEDFGEDSQAYGYAAE